jgi:hypothetical protein
MVSGVVVPIVLDDLAGGDDRPAELRHELIGRAGTVTARGPDEADAAARALVEEPRSMDGIAIRWFLMGSPATTNHPQALQLVSDAELLGMDFVHVTRLVVPTICTKRPEVAQRKRYTMPQRVVADRDARVMADSMGSPSASWRVNKR